MKRMIVAMVLTFLIFTSTTAVYSQMKGSDDVFIDSISDFYLVDQQLVSDTNATLVPIGAIRGVNDVYEIEYTYEVIVKDGMDLNVMIEDLLFSTGTLDADTLRNTFTFEIEQSIIETLEYNDHFFGQGVTANRIEISVKVSMNEPASYEIYQQLVGGNLQFEVYLFAA
jgi:hypothetical protein